MLIAEYEDYISAYLKRKGYLFWTNINSKDHIQVVMHVACMDGIEELLIKLHRKLQKKWEFDLCIGIGSMVDKYEQIPISAAESSEVLAYKYQYADRGVINISNIVRLRYNISYVSGEKFDQILGCFKDGNLGKMSERLDELVSEVRYRKNVSNSSIKRTIIELTVNMLHIASSANVDVDTILQDDDPYHWILQQDNTPEIKDWFMKLSSRLLVEMSNQNTRHKKKIILDACEYIKTHINDNTIGLQSVSEHAGLSASYFSQLFKQEMGIGLNSYIACSRIEQAKTLLRESELKNEDIALQLGFVRTNYFNSVFKRIVGVSPGEYRKQNRRAAE